VRKALAALFLLFGCAKTVHVPALSDPSYRIMATEQENTFIVQVPRGKTAEDFLKEIGCGEQWVCAVGSDAIYIIQRKPKPKG